MKTNELLKELVTKDLREMRFKGQIDILTAIESWLKAMEGKGVKQISTTVIHELIGEARKACFDEFMKP